jgi:agmatine deiminase
MDVEPDVNLDCAVGYIREAASRGAQIVCLPELFRSPYFCRKETSPREYAEAVPGATGKILADEAKRGNIAIIGGSVYEATPEGTRFNTALVYTNNGTLAGTYRKLHIPHDPGFFERHYFAEGDMGYQVFDLGFAKVSVLICFDQWFPEAARSAVLAGAEILFYPTAIGTVADVPEVEGSWQDAWETVQRGHAIANNVVICPVNRVGTEGDTTFWGGSFVANGFGSLLAKAGSAPELVMAQADLGHSQHTRDSWRFFASRRPDQYHALVSDKE